MKKNITLAIKVNRLKLEKMISDGEDYEKILRQSQKLDQYINMAMKEKLAKHHNNE